MPSTGLSGPYALTADNISKVVTQKSAGAYALGDTNSQNTFIVRYVGRSDDNLAARLCAWTGKYSQFKAGYLDSPKEAFEKECHLYHDFGETRLLDNKIHPDRPHNSNWTCPRCQVYG